MVSTKSWCRTSLYLLYNLYLCWGHQRCSKHSWKSDSRICCIKSVLPEECYSFLTVKWSGTGEPRERLNYRNPFSSGLQVQIWTGPWWLEVITMWCFSGDLHGTYWWAAPDPVGRCPHHKRHHFSLVSWQLYQRNQGINGHNRPLFQPLLSLNWQAITEEPALGNCKNREYTTVLLTTELINYNISSLPCQFQVALSKAQFEARPSQGGEKRRAASQITFLCRGKVLTVLL